MSTAFYWWRATRRSSWRAALTVALIGGLVGAVALGALAGARRTASAYGRYLASINASDALVNVPGKIPGIPVTRPMTLISRLPGVASAAAYVGLNAFPVIHGKVVYAFQAGGLAGSLTGPSFSSDGFRQDRLSVLAGRLPAVGSTGQIALTAGLARSFGVGVGGKVTYFFSNAYNPAARSVRRTYRVTAIVAVPPVLVDQSDQTNTAALPPAATRQALAFYQFAWVGVRLDRGTAGIPALQYHLAGLASALVRQLSKSSRQNATGLAFNIRPQDLIHSQVQQAIRPQAIALAVLGIIAGLAMLVLVGQGLAQVLSRSAAGISAMRALGATRAQAALSASLPGAIAIVGAVIIAVAGAIALSPLAPVGPVRQFDPARGVRADGLVLGAGSVLLAAILLGLLAVMAARAVRQPSGPSGTRLSVTARAAAAAGLPAVVIVGTRNALEPGSGRRTIPVRATLLGSVATATVVVATVVFGTSLAGLLSHPARYGWNWDVLLQAEGGYGNWLPSAMSKLIDGQPAVGGWSTFGFSQLPVDGTVVPVLGVQRQSGFVEPPTTSGRPITGNGQIELGTVTMRKLGQHIGDTVRVGLAGHQRPLTIVGTVTLPSFGQALAEHVSLGSGAMLSEDALLTADGLSTFPPHTAAQLTHDDPSAVAIDLVPGTSAAQRARLVREITSANPDGTRGGTYQLTQYRAAAIVYESHMGGQPLALALGLAGAAVLSLALTLLAAVRGRRRELGLLKALGMTRRQVRAIVAWQASTILIIAAVVGVPLGIAGGRWAWAAFANSLGVVTVTAVPVTLLVLGVLALLAAGNLLAGFPAAVAARTRPAAALRVE
jgi:ABC-type lipoprotein release transport system permease subunit